MINIRDFLIKHPFPAVMVAAFTGVVLLTSASSTVKVAGSMSKFKPEVPEVKTVENALEEDSNLTPTVTLSPTVTPELTTTPTVSPTVIPTVTPTPTISSTGPSIRSRIQIDDDTEIEHEDRVSDHSKTEDKVSQESESNSN